MSMTWLKRVPAQAWSVLRAITAYLVFLALPIITLIAAPYAGVPLWIAVVSAFLVDFLVLLLWLFWRLFTWVVAESAARLWAMRTFRFIAWSVYAAAAVTLAYWNARDAEGYAVYGWIAEAIGLAFFHAALYLAKPQPLADRFFDRLRKAVPAKWDGVIHALHVIAWLIAIALVDRWLYAVVYDWLGGNWIVIPWESLEKIRVPLAILSPILFTIAALLAHPPFVRRARPRWVVGIEVVSAERGERIFRLFRYVPLVLIKRQRRVVTLVRPDGKTVEVGERFVFKRMMIAGVAFMVFASVAAFSVAANVFTASLPEDLSALEAFQPVVSTRVFDRHDKLMCTFTLENRTFLNLSEIPKLVQEAFKASEDKNFDSHEGFDPNGMIRAQIVNWATGRTSQGASTLDQQLIKKIILQDSSRSYVRKLSEVALATRLERQMTAKYGRAGAKGKILEVYLNYVFLGRNAGGIAAASEQYFGKTVKELDLAEAAMLAGLPKAPSDDAPEGHFARAKVRQRYVLGRMLETGAISAIERDAALDEDIVLIRRPYLLNAAAAPFACEHVRSWAEKTFGHATVYKHGLDIKTTFDLDLQEKAQMAVRYGLLDLERRIGFEGPEGHDAVMSGRCDAAPEEVADNAIEANARVVDRKGEAIAVCVRGNRFPLDPDDAKRVVAWEHAERGHALVIGDLLTVRMETRGEGKDDKKTTKRYALTARRTGGIEHPEAIQSALVAMEPGTGFIRAIVGSYSWDESQYDNATQAHRQTGSSIKPYIYLTGLMNGKTVVSKVLDGPICVSTASGPWCPKNYKNDKMSTSYFGEVDLATALAKSLNSVSVRLILDTGIDKAIGTMRALGVRSKIIPVLPVAVGTPELTLIEHTAGYASILSGGKTLPSQVEGGNRGIFVSKVTEHARDTNGSVITHTVYEVPPAPNAQSVPSGDAYAMTQLMKGVVEFGTSTRAKRLRRPVAGKTGTTNRFADAWFMGGSADLTVGVWVGRKTNQSIAKEATGGVVALPIWEGFMEAAHLVTDDSPARDFPIPDDVTLIHKGDKRDGIPTMIPFQRGKMPKKYLTAPDLKFGQGSFD